MCEVSLKLAGKRLQKRMRFNQGYKYKQNKVKGLSLYQKLIVLNNSADAMKSNSSNYRITTVNIVIYQNWPK